MRLIRIQTNEILNSIRINILCTRPPAPSLYAELHRRQPAHAISLAERVQINVSSSYAPKRCETDRSHAGIVFIWIYVIFCAALRTNTKVSTVLLLHIVHNAMRNIYYREMNKKPDGGMLSAYFNRYISPTRNQKKKHFFFFHKNNNWNGDKKNPTRCLCRETMNALIRIEI